MIDWEAGILGALRGVLSGRDVRSSDDELLALFARIEGPIQREQPFRPYRDVLDETTRQIAAHYGVVAGPNEVGALRRSLPDWPPFPDTIAALRALARHYRLGVISNVDDDLFAETARRLETDFSWVVTAEHAGSYKPARNNFHRALERIGLPWNQVLHVAQSLYHDVAPARSLGLATVWVNRRRDRPGFGATPPSSATPDLEVPDLASLARRVESAA